MIMTKKLSLFAVKSCLLLVVAVIISVSSKPAVAGEIKGDKCADTGGNCPSDDVCRRSLTSTDYYTMVSKTDIFIYGKVESTSATIACGKLVHCANFKIARSQPDCDFGRFYDTQPREKPSCVAETRVGGTSCANLVKDGYQM